VIVSIHPSRAITRLLSAFYFRNEQYIGPPNNFKVNSEKLHRIRIEPMPGTFECHTRTLTPLTGLHWVGYVSWVQVVLNVGKPETDLFCIAGEFWDCSQIILPLEGEGCSRSAHLAGLTIIVYSEFRIRCILPYNYPSRRSRECQRSEIRSDIRW
jgi:hypothetical protein